VIIEKDGQVIETQFLDNLMTWTPSRVFGAGTYRWTVQSWKTVGFGMVSAPAVFTIAASPAAQPIMPGPVAASTGGEATASTVPTAFSTHAVRLNNTGKVSISASAGDGQQEMSVTTVSTATEPASLSVLGAYGTAAMIMPPDAAVISATSEGTENGNHRDALSTAVEDEETTAAGILGAVRYLNSVLPDEDRASSDRGVASSSGPATDRNSQPASLQNAEDGGFDVRQTGETGMELVNARRGYIAPIDIVVGPMNDPGAKQALLTAKKIAEKPNNAV
jgi:hypothetical protein